MTRPPDAAPSSPTPAPAPGWYADPQDPSRWRYWDGAVWTEHRAPRTTAGVTSDQVAQVGADIADGIASAFTSVGQWVQRSTATSGPTTGAPGTPTFASVAAACHDEPPREPLSREVALVVGPEEAAAVRALAVGAGHVVTPEGVDLPEQAARLVPNPWDPSDPTGVAVLVGTARVGRLPADAAAEYCPPLARLASRQVLATARVRIRVRGDAATTSVEVTAALPEPAALG